MQWTDEAIFAAIQSVASDGRVSSGDYYRIYNERDHPMPSMSIILRRFDTWGEAVEAAGLKTLRGAYGPRRDRTSPEDCLLSLGQCAHELGKLPTYAEYEAWAQRFGAVDARTLRKQMGSWMNAIDTFLRRSA